MAFHNGQLAGHFQTNDAPAPTSALPPAVKGPKPGRVPLDASTGFIGCQMVGDKKALSKHHRILLTRTPGPATAFCGRGTDADSDGASPPWCAP